MKKLIQSNIFYLLLLVIILVAGCDEIPITPDAPKDDNRSSLKKAVSAILHIWSYNPNDDIVNIYAVSSDWSEIGVTWNTKPNTYSNIEASFVTSVKEDWITVDITGLVNKWLTGSFGNYGLLLDKQSPYAEVFQSREGVNKPFIEVTYEDGGSANIIDIADAEINEPTPDKHFGSTDVLFAGIVDGYQKQSLIKFDFRYIPFGCTLNRDYWQTHSKYGPAVYDDTWEMIGEDIPFFMSGKTYYSTINGTDLDNAYYELSSNYIAAKLNMLNGADFSAVQATFDEATILLQTFTPEYLSQHKSMNIIRSRFIQLAEILHQYNEGYIGPGSCNDLDMIQ